MLKYEFLTSYDKITTGINKIKDNGGILTPGDKGINFELMGIFGKISWVRQGNLYYLNITINQKPIFISEDIIKNTINDYFIK